MAKDKMARVNFMSNEQKTKMGNLPRTHENCKMLTGVNRPGKTAQDRARRHSSNRED